VLARTHWILVSLDGARVLGEVGVRWRGSKPKPEQTQANPGIVILGHPLQSLHLGGVSRARLMALSGPVVKRLYLQAACRYDKIWGR